MENEAATDATAPLGHVWKTVYPAQMLHHQAAPVPSTMSGDVHIRHAAGYAKASTMMGVIRLNTVHGWIEAAWSAYSGALARLQTM